jgi:hypothetical protein
VSRLDDTIRFLSKIVECVETITATKCGITANPSGISILREGPNVRVAQHITPIVEEALEFSPEHRELTISGGWNILRFEKHFVII